MSILGQSLVLSLAVAASGVLAQASPSRSSQVESSHAIQAEAWQIVLLANQSRAEAGAGPLKWDAALATAARKHCLHMAADGSISHQYKDEPDVSGRASQTGARFSLIEENVAVGPDAATIHDAWMHSHGHRVNLLNPAVDRVGVAVVAGRRGLYAVADYERVVPELTPAQVEAKVEATIAGPAKANGVAVVHDTAIARTACVLAEGLPHAKSGPQPRFMMRWQNADLTHLPQALAERMASGKFHQAAVGSCPSQGVEGPFTAYRIAVLLF